MLCAPSLRMPPFHLSPVWPFWLLSSKLELLPSTSEITSNLKPTSPSGAGPAGAGDAAPSSSKTLGARAAAPLPSPREDPSRTQILFQYIFPTTPPSGAAPSRSCPRRGKGLCDGSPPPSPAEEDGGAPTCPRSLSARATGSSSTICSPQKKRSSLKQQTFRGLVEWGRAARPRTPQPCRAAGAPGCSQGAARPRLTGVTSVHPAPRHQTGL